MARGNRDNLIPANERSCEEVKELGRKGGIKSGKTRRKKADLKKAMNSLLTSKVNNKKIEEKLAEFGLEPTFENAMTLQVLNKAIALGNVNAYLAILETVGNKDDADKAEQNARIEKLKAETEAIKQDVDGKSDAAADSLDWKTAIIEAAEKRTKAQKKKK